MNYSFYLEMRKHDISTIKISLIIIATMVRQLSPKDENVFLATMAQKIDGIISKNIF